MPATIVIRRQRTAYRDRARRYNVTIDGEGKAGIRPGGEDEYPVDVGRHVVQFRVDWCRTKPVELDLTDGQRIAVTCRASGGPFTIWQIVLAPSKYIVAEVASA